MPSGEGIAFTLRSHLRMYRCFLRVLFYFILFYFIDFISFYFLIFYLILPFYLFFFFFNTISGQNRPENNGNEKVHHTPQSSRIGRSSSDEVYRLMGISPPPHPTSAKEYSQSIRSIADRDDFSLSSQRSFLLVYLLYAHICRFTSTYTHNNKDGRNDKDRRTQKDAGRLLYKYLPLTLLQGFEKGYSRFVCERELETEHNWNILTPNLWPSRCVFLVLLMLNRSPGVHSAGWWLSLLHLISIFSGPQFIRALSPFGLVWLSLPHLVSSGTQLASSNSTELYNRSTPTRSLKSNV